MSETPAQNQGEAPKETPVVPPAPAQKEKIKYEDFAKLDLRVVRVLDAKEHPNAEKLLLLTVDLGDSQRQIVAGIKKWYPPEALVGKTIVIVANLEPAKLRGEISDGMLLAVSDTDRVVVLTTEKDGVAPGSKIS